MTERWELRSIHKIQFKHRSSESDEGCERSEWDFNVKHRHQVRKADGAAPEVPDEAMDL